MNRIKSTKELTSNARIIRAVLLNSNNQVLLAKDLNSLVMDKLECSKRTAQRTIKELYNCSQLTTPVAYKVTINS